MLFVIRDSKSATGNFLSGEKVATQLGIEAANVDVADTQHLTRRLREAVQIINDHLVSQYQKRHVYEPNKGQWGKVLVFCESGNERSATVVAAYLMAMYQVDAVHAIQYVQAQRFCVAFDDGLKNLLLSYQDLVQAERMTTRARRQTPVVSFPPVSKRGRDDMSMDDEDVDMDASQADDESRFTGRRFFAPFQDNDNSNNGF
jgi:serine/threonine/tyrosine-interacting protein